MSKPKYKSVAKEIIELDLIFQRVVKVESMSKADGVIAASALNRLKTLALSAESILAKGPTEETSQVQGG